MHSSLLALVAPPALRLPSLFDAALGWLLGITLFVVPSAYLAWRSHTILGHWSRYFAQFHRAAWWLQVFGSAALAFGSFALLGILPTWQRHWNDWLAATRREPGAQIDALRWLSQTQQQYVTLLQIGAVALCIAGFVTLIIGMWRFQKTILIRRTPVAPSSGWMMAPR